MSVQPSTDRPKLLNFITGNANKLTEVRAILEDVPGLELQSRNVEGAEIQGSIEEVARDKCSRAAVAVSSFVFPFVGCENMREMARVGECPEIKKRGDFRLLEAADAFETPLCTSH
jgi:hypothetical protein